ncbi:hypothetical protein JZU54_00315, partial [bacterium]|nr:hypothetical protein [bacterium]
AQSGAVDIRTGGATDVRELRNFADVAGKNIELRVNGDVRIDLIEAATSAGATKLHGSITVEATGNLSEWKAPVRDASGTVTSYAYDQTSADLYGSTVSLIGAPTLTPVWLKSGMDKGTDAELEARVISADALAFDVTLEGRTLSDDSIKGAGGGTISITSSTSVQAGTNTKQRNRITFGALTQVGRIYTVTIDSTAIPFTSTGSDMSSVLQSLATAIETAKTGIDVTVDAGDYALSLEARVANTSFVVNGVTVTENYVGAVPAGVSDAGTTPVVAAGFEAAQTSTVSFGAAQTVAADQRYSVMVNGHDYAVQTGANASVWVTSAATISVNAKEWGTTTALGSVTASAVLSLGTAATAQATTGGTPTPATIDTTGWTWASGATYSLKIGSGTPFTVTANATNSDMTKVRMPVMQQSWLAMSSPLNKTMPPPICRHRPRWSPARPRQIAPLMSLG